MEGLAQTSEDRWREAARAHPSKLGVLASVGNLRWTARSDRAHPAGRKSPRKTALLLLVNYSSACGQVDEEATGTPQHGEKVPTGREERFLLVFYQL